MMRTTTRPPTGSCSLPMYMGFLMSEPNSANCSRLAEVMGISHDSVNRFLLREAYEPNDLFEQVKGLVNLVGGTRSVDDSVLDKPYSPRMALVGHFWSGNHHRVVKGLNLITLYYTDLQGQNLPVNDRVYDKAEHKSKNEYFLEMLEQVLAWGLKPSFMTGDSWYSSANNLKTVKHHRLGFLFAVENNRRVSIEKGRWVQVQQLDIPAEGRLVWLREYGEVKLFRTPLKDQQRHYVVYLPQSDAYLGFGQSAFKKLHDQHWQIEQYHRMIKQVCHIEAFQVRGQLPILNHIFAALCRYVHLQQMRFADLISNAYQWQRVLYQDVVASFVNSFLLGKEHLNPQFRPAVNA